MFMLFSQADAFGAIISFAFLFLLLILYPRFMLSQLIYKIEQSAQKMEALSRKANIVATKKASKKPSKELKNKIDEFTDFFVVEPSNIDPFGLVKKIDHTIRGMEVRFNEFSGEIGGELSSKEIRELNYALRAAIGLRQISKIVRHFVETAKKFKNLQIAMILQMQLPIIEKIAESEYHGTIAFANGWPIGDSIGPLVAASFIDKAKPIAEDIVYDEVDIEGRRCFVMKATGPMPSLGRVDEAIEKIMKKNKISRVVTIDAAQKLEGEKTGSIAEGVGFAMGGIGQREIIENVLLPGKIPIDGVVVKVGMTEAIMPMRKSIFDSVENARKKVATSVKRCKKGEKLIIIGVGNSCGIGDTKKDIGKVRETVEKLEKKYKEEEQKKKKRKWI